ncbi:MAG TPA: WbqC family protein [Bacteroidales bacterium]
MAFILSTSYLGPIQYYSKLISSEKIILERFESYPKQTYRNRCIIYSANGPQMLTIPVTKGRELKMYTKDICIDNSMNWPKLHFKSIESAYRCSPFYQYYIDDFIPFYEKKYQFLYDFNFKLLTKINEIIGMECNIEETNEYIKNIQDNYMDFRDIIHPKKRMYTPDTTFQHPVYHQVFEPKHGFIANLSIIDLIFNVGPETSDLLKESVIQ